MRKLNDFYIFVIAATAGLAIWLSISALSGEREAWDSSYFVTIGYPCMALVSALAGFAQPRHPWLWGFATVAFQPIALYWGHNPLEGQFGPLGLLFFAAFAVILSFCAMAGGALGRKLSLR